jgi:hypothetical protein
VLLGEDGAEELVHLPVPRAQGLSEPCGWAVIRQAEASGSAGKDHRD